MAGIDPSIYGQIAPAADPFALPNKLIGLQQGALGVSKAQIENELLQRGLAGQKALQGALSDAIDPATGQIDTNKLVGGLRGTPGASLIPGAVQEGQHIVGGNIANTGAGMALNTGQISTLGQSYGAALQGGGAFGRKEAMAGIISAVASGQIDPKVGNTLLHQIPRDDAGAKAWANSLYLRTQPSAGSVGTIGTNATGAPVAGTAGQAFTKAVGAVPTDANGAALNPDGTPTTNNVAPNGKSVVAPPAKVGTMGYVSGLAPGQASSAGISLEGAAQQAAAFEKQANAAVDNKATISNMEDELKGIVTGPAADSVNKWKSLANQAGDVALGKESGPRFPQGDIAKMESFRKNAQILANQQFSSLGGTGTDAQLGAAIHSNPSELLSNEGNRQILAMLKGNQDAIEAKTTAWRQYQKQAGAGANFNTFSEDFNRNFNPRAFQWVHMTPTERREFINRIGGEGTPDKPNPRYQQLNEAMQTAIQRGWINPPGAAK